MAVGGTKHVQRVVNHVQGSVVPHNFQVGHLVVDPEWVEDSTAEDNSEPEPTSNGSSEPVCRRRKKPVFHLIDLQDTSIN